MKENILVHGAKLTRDDFRKTIPEFGIMPFWFVNGAMTYDEMEYQLREYKLKGIPGIYIHARFGTLSNTGYLTEDWFDRLRFAVQKAREIGLQIWVYDEYNWPSGTAGKQVRASDPNLTQRYLELVESRIPGQFFTFMEGTDSRYNDLEESEPIYACAILEENIQNKRFEYVDLMQSLAFDKVITWEAPPGPWRLMYFIERRANWYADVLNEEATDKFLALTHERYKRELSANGPIANSIHGFYTDEPAMHYFEVAKDNYILPWSSRMQAIFKEHNGYDLLRHLPKLFYDFGGDTQQFRYDFFSALTKQYEKSYYKKIEDWCRENGLTFTGHLLFEEWLRLHARTGGNLFTHLKHLHMTGVDHLYPRIGNKDMPDEHVALKLASSAAHQFGSTRLLCESMGGAYWDCTMERMKWIADWEYVLGVNLFNPHGFHYSIEGERKRDWPPSMFYHHTWWPQYKQFNDYVSRMGYILSGGHHVAKAALLYPINSIWAQYTPQMANAQSAFIQREFNYMTDRLLRLHVDFDYLDEDVMDDCEMADGRITIRGESYECLILPGVTHIKEKTLSRLEAFVSGGGKVIADGLLPMDAIEGSRENFRERVQALFGQDPVQVHEAFLQGAQLPGALAKAHGQGGKAILCPAGFEKGDNMAYLESVIRSCVESEIFIDQEEVFYLHRVKDGEDFFFLVNPTQQPLETKVRIRGMHAPDQWNLETGDISPIAPYTLEGGFTCFTLSLPRVGSAMIHLLPAQEKHISDTNLTIASFEGNSITAYGRAETGEAYVTVNASGRETRFAAQALTPLPPISPEGAFAARFSSPNALILNHWKVHFEDETVCRDRVNALDTSAPGWMDFVMGSWELQLPAERPSRFYPVTLWYVTRFACETKAGDLAMMIDGFKGDYEIYLNGNLLTEKPVRSYLDAEILSLPLPDAVIGENTLAVRMTVHGKSGGILDLLKLTGTFTVRDDIICAPVSTLRLGDWCRQGYPYLASMVDYEKEIILPEGYQDKVLLLSADVGDDLFQVFIDGVPAGTRLWSPYVLDITPFVTSGRFTLCVRVVNTIANLLTKQGKESGLRSLTITPYDRYNFFIDQ